MTLYVILALITFTGSRKREAQRVLGDIIVRENEYKEILSALLGLLNEGVHIVAGPGDLHFLQFRYGQDGTDGAGRCGRPAF